MRHSLCWLVGLAVVLSGPATARSATLLKAQLVPDGSTQPPGDRLDVTVLLLPGEDEIDLETRAFAKLEGQGRVVPVPSKDPALRDAQGDILVRSTLRREGDSRSVEARVVIPYAAMNLPQGRHELGYEVRGIRRGRPDFVRATPLTIVVISQNTRTTILQQQARAVPQAARKTMTVHVAERGKVTTRDVVIETRELTQVREVRTARVNIPGEF